MAFDPGVNGAIAVLDRDGRLEELLDVPVITVKRKEIDVVALNRVVLRYANEDCIAGVEQVTSNAAPQAQASFTLGGSYYLFRGLCCANALPCERININTWKQYFSLKNKDKDASRGRASELYPSADLSRKKDHNKADALLMARWLWRQYRFSIKSEILERKVT